MSFQYFNQIIDFYKIWIKDCLFWPIEHLKKKKAISNIKPNFRSPINSDKLYINIHEWGGYEPKRTKKIKGIKTFECGLFYQICRFNHQTSNKLIDLSITISEIDKYPYISNIKKLCNNIYAVSNQGMDFSGYACIYNIIKDKPNAYVILTNSSVNRMDSDFLDSYISYMDGNPDVGILGISSCSKYYHTLLRNNFNPHIQSFFLLTTISVLNEIIDYNKGIFPGIGETNKHLLIRNGEVLISKSALMLGYNLAVVFDNKVQKFNYKSYNLPKGDLRRYSKYPNGITPIYTT